MLVFRTAVYGCFSLLVVSRVLVSRVASSNCLLRPIGIRFDYFELNVFRAQGQRDAAVGSRFARVGGRHTDSSQRTADSVRRRLSPLIQLGSRGEWFFGKLCVLLIASHKGPAGNNATGSRAGFRRNSSQCSAAAAVIIAVVGQ